MMPPWRERLRKAVDATGRKHSAVAWDAAMNAATLSRILNGREHPAFEAVVRIAQATGVTVGWLLDETPGSIEFTDHQRATLREAGAILLDTIRS